MILLTGALKNFMKCELVNCKNLKDARRQKRLASFLCNYFTNVNRLKANYQ